MGAFFSPRESGFPPSLEDAYRPLSCLKADQEAAVFLAQRRSDGLQVIVHAALDDMSQELQQNEARLLEKIAANEAPEARAFPRPIERCQADGTSILIREYIPGQSLEDLVESQTSRPGLPRREAVAYVCALLRLLSFLHRMDPPVIHRDIKPQNVIIDPKGGCHLIDLGISRQRLSEGDADTHVMGTRMTAPPEQFGYRPTDERSDIYSTGVLLRYCLTGEYDRSADEGLDPGLRRVVARATQFDPRRRYQSAEAMGNALRHGAQTKGARLRWLALLLVPLLLAAALLPGRARPGRFDRRGVYHFREPLLEQAVRQALGTPGKGLTAEDLAGVTTICIFGRQICQSDDEFQFMGEYTLPLREEDDSWRVNGGIRSLQDLAALPGLRSLSLYRQEIDDLSALKDTNIAHLGLGLNPLQDLTPLSGNGRVTSLNVTALPVEDLTVVATMPGLEVLEISGCPVTSLEGLRELPLRRLNLANVPSEDFGAVASLDRLQSLTVNKMSPQLLEALKETPLAELEITGEEWLPLDRLNALPGLRRLEYRAAEPRSYGGTALELAALEQLDLRNLRMPSLQCLSGLRALRTLAIRECECESLEGLSGLESLERVLCSPEQAEALRTLYPERNWRTEAE